MKKLLSLIVILGLLACAGTAFGFPFTYDRSYVPTYTPTPDTFSFSSSYSSIESPYGVTSASSIGWSCDDCTNIYTSAYTDEITFDDGVGSIRTASATLVLETGIICEEPPICNDFDDDGVCDESDNCEFDPNTDQSDIDNDGIGDVCDQLNDCGDIPCEEPDPCAADDTACLLEEACPCENDWRNHGAYVTCTVKFRNDNTIQGVPQLPDLEHIVSEAGCSDCGGSHQGQGCED